MKPEQIIEMWRRTSRQAPLATYDDLIDMLATEIAKISYKLDEDELFRMLAIGALIYQRGYREFGGDITADLLIKTLREGGSA
ncbi:hypothetical protein ACVBEF_13760 [Glaciimonas sp. GG7]